MSSKPPKNDGDSIEEPESSFSQDFLNDVFSVGLNARKEKSIERAAFVAAVLLSVTSGYTTFHGLTHYLPTIFAGAGVLGIQGLLLASSWRIGQTAAEDRFNIVLKAIFLGAMLSSVHFSFSSLFDAIYKKDKREEDQLRRAQIVAVDIWNEVVEKNDLYIESLKKNVTSRLYTFHDQLIAGFSEQLSPLKKSLILEESKAKEFDRMYEDEIDIGLIKNNGKYTSAGLGTEAKKILSKKRDHEFQSLKPLQEKISKIDGHLDQIGKIFQSIVDSDIPDPKTISQYTVALHEINSYFLDSETFVKTFFPEELLQNISSLQQACKDTSQKKISFSSFRTTEGLYNYILEAVAETALNPEEKEYAIQQIKRINQFEGANTHQFVLCLSELAYGNPLAIGALIMALIVDSLILFCGLLGGRPDSFLSLKEPDDLMEHAELALEIILSLNLYRQVEPRNPYSRRILEIFNNLSPDLNLAKRGYPATIQIEEIKNNKFSQEMGVFLSMNLAIKTKDGGKVALSTRLLLWMANQLVNTDTKISKFSKFKQSTERIFKKEKGI